MKKFHNKDFQLIHLKWLYQQALEYQEMRDQWSSLNNLDRALHYHNKFQAMVECLENLTVFYVGLGLDLESKGVHYIYSVDDRFKSFKKLLSK